MSTSDPASASRRRVAIVGAGVSGLVCAKTLAEQGCNLDIVVFESKDRVGGRVVSERREDGFILDHGFQILIKSYPEVCRQLDLGALNLRSFGQGAVLAHGDGTRSVFANPLTCPKHLLQTLRLILGRWGLFATLKDLVRLLLRVVLPGWVGYWNPYRALQRRWGMQLPWLPREAPPRHDSPLRIYQSTRSFLREHVGLDSAFLSEFLDPFFQAIYVSPLEEQHPAMFEFVLRMLAVPGSASLPERGMQAIPEQLLRQAEAAVAREGSTNTLKVLLQRKKSAGEGEELFDATVVATNWESARQLIGNTHADRTEKPCYSASETWYFSLPEKMLPVNEPLIMLNAAVRQKLQPGATLHTPLLRQTLGESEEALDFDEGFRVCNIGFPSVVQRSYAPSGYHICAVTVMRHSTLKTSTESSCQRWPDEPWLRSQLARMLGSPPEVLAQWQLLERIPVSFHQPLQAPGTLEVLLSQAQTEEEEEEQQQRPTLFCGDWRATPTLDGALVSGRRSAERVLAKLALGSEL